jgi:hypothetical protein
VWFWVTTAIGSFPTSSFAPRAPGWCFQRLVSVAVGGVIYRCILIRYWQSIPQSCHVSQEEIESEKADVDRMHPKYKPPELDNLYSKEFIDVKVMAKDA